MRHQIRGDSTEITPCYLGSFDLRAFMAFLSIFALKRALAYTQDNPG